MARSKRFLSGLLLTYSHQAVVMLVGLWLTPFVLGRVGQYYYGIWLVGMQVLTYLTLVDIGVIALLPREIAYATGRAGGALNSTELPRIIGRTARIVFCQMPFVILGTALMWFLMPPTWYAFRGPIALILITFIGLFPLRIFPAIINGLQDLAFAGKVQIVAWMAGTVATVGLVSVGFQLYALAIGWAITQVFSTVAMAYRIWRRHPQILPVRWSDFSTVDLKNYLTRGLWMSMSQIAQPLVNGIDIVVIGKMLGPSAVVVYSCTGKLSSILANQPKALMQAAIPGLSEIKAGESKEHIFRVTSALMQGSLMLSGAVCCVVLVVNQGFVNWWVGANQYSGHTLTLLIVICMLLRHWNLAVACSAFCYGYEKRLSLLYLLDGLMTFGATLALVKWLGVMGGPLASIASVCLITLPANLSILAREGGVPLSAFLLPLVSWLWRFSLVAAAATIFGRVRPPANFWETAAAGILTGFVYIAIMLPVGYRSALWPYLKPRLIPIRNAFSAKIS